jgi:hypothetical protein
VSENYLKSKQAVTGQGLLTSVAENCAVVLLSNLDHRPSDDWAGKTGSEQVISMLVVLSMNVEAEYLTSVLIDCVA